MRGLPSDDFQEVFRMSRLWWTGHLVAKSLICSTFFNRPTEPHPAAFILPSIGRVPSAAQPHTQTCENVRPPAKHAQTTHHGLRSEISAETDCRPGGLSVVGDAPAGPGERDTS